MSKIQKFRCKSCNSIFNRSAAVEKLELVENTSGSSRFSKVLGYPECPSSNLHIEEMG